MKGKVCRGRVQSILGYVNETWVMKVEDMARLERTERMMVRWMCGVHLKSRTASAEIHSLCLFCSSRLLRRLVNLRYII